MKTNRYKTWVAQGKYKSLGLQGNKKGVKMVLVLGENGTTLEPLKKTNYGQITVNALRRMK